MTNNQKPKIFRLAPSCWRLEIPMPSVRLWPHHPMTWDFASQAEAFSFVCAWLSRNSPLLLFRPRFSEEVPPPTKIELPEALPVRLIR